MSMTPREIVEELDKHIIGQHDAKRAVAIALRNRWRRAQIKEPLRSEITPKNILMIGPTGVGKTEIARRLAKLAHAPFIKVEATKFTEVGYVGRDVDSIVRDLVDMAVKLVREEAVTRVADRAADAAEDRLLDALLPGSRTDDGRDTRQRFRKMLREGELDDREVELDLAAAHARRRDHGAARHGRDDEPAAELVPEPASGPLEAPQAEGQGRARAAEGGRGRQAHQPRGREAAGRQGRRGERHRLHRRDRQDRAPCRGARRRRIARRRAARSVAARRRLHGQHALRHGAHRPRAVHRVGRVQRREAFGPDSRAAGPFPDSRRAHGARRRRVRANPDGAERVVDGAVQELARDGALRRALRAERRAPARRGRVPGQRPQREHRRAAAAYRARAVARDRDRSTLRIAAARASWSTPRTSTLT